MIEMSAPAVAQQRSNRVRFGGNNTPRSQGADVVQRGVRYRTWSQHRRVDAAIVDDSGEILRTMPLEPEGDGYFSTIDEQGRAGDLYRYRLGGGDDWPDPASRWQPFGVHGASMVIDPDGFGWSDQEWTAPGFNQLVIYELHVGTFTPEGTFRAAISKLQHVASLGVNAIEIMPIADFPGERNWGYDGVMLYAPARVYGNPNDLRALVDAAHAHGLAVILDVVYNHLGPDGNYVGVYHPGYFNPEHKTPWGDAFNLELPPVRSLFAENPAYWMREFHVDGFRLDATHEIYDPSPRHLLSEIAERVHENGGFVTAEDERNEPQLLLPTERCGMGFDGCWADDFHHVIRVMLTREREGYYRNFHGTPAELAETLAHGWLFRGQHDTAEGERRGGDTTELRPEQFVYCISNHDQVGNRAFGERLGHIAGAAAYRAASALLCLVPQTPLLFMGQEWSASTAFQYFTDHSDELGRSVTKGRRHEFRHFAAFADPESLTSIPDPQAERTFRNSKLRWDEVPEQHHQQVLQLYRDFLHLRRTHPAFRDRSRANYRVDLLEHGIVALLVGLLSERRCVVLVDLIGGHNAPRLHDSVFPLNERGQWRHLLSSNEDRFGGTGTELFRVPTTVVREAV
jgi:maltooligosyltrehalose trehalohydrolase